MLFYFGSYSVFIATIATLVGLDIVVVVTRLWVRKSLRTKTGLDDWFAILALFLNIGLAVSAFIGLGQHTLNTRYGDTYVDRWGTEYSKKLVINGKIQYVTRIMSVTALVFIKLSFLAFYKRVFVYDKTNFRNPRTAVIHLTMGLVALWGLGFLLILFTGCGKHFHASYARYQEKVGKCVNDFLYIHAFAISDFITDFVILLIPVPFIWKLHLSVQRKVGITFVFLLGVFATACSLIRMIWIQYMMDKSGSKMPTTKAVDMTFIAVSTEVFWFIVEPTVALLAACLPPLAGIRRTAPVESLLRSVQSKLSLRSGRSSIEDASSLTVKEVSVETNTEVVTEPERVWLNQSPPMRLHRSSERLTHTEEVNASSLA